MRSVLVSGARVQIDPSLLACMLPLPVACNVFLKNPYGVTVNSDWLICMRDAYA